MPRSHRVGQGAAAAVCCLAAVLVVGIGVVLAAGHAGVARAQDWSLLTTPTPPPVAIFGTYNRGCLEGAEALPLDGDGYQVMRLSRGRYYGHPDLVRFVEALAADLRAEGHPGLLIGDMAQARGGPMAFGHASHQIGLDVDIWFLPAPARRLGDDERENLVAPSMVALGGLGVTADWGPAQIAALRRAAAAPEVDRIFINPAIKKELCQTIQTDRGWLGKLRPWWGHDAHFHVRLACPADQYGCIAQPPLPPQDGCDAGLDWWFSAAARAELEKQKRASPARRLTLEELPAGCLAVFSAG